MRKQRFVIYLIILVLLLTSCISLNNKKYKDFKSQVWISIRIFPRVLHNISYEEYEVSCQIKDEINTNFSNMRIIVDNQDIPYKYTKSFGSYFNGMLSKKYESGDRIKISIFYDSDLLDTLYVSIPESPEVLNIEPTIPSFGVENTQKFYNLSWNKVRGANQYLVNTLWMKYYNNRVSGSSGIGFYTTFTNHILSQQALLDENQNPYKWISIQLYSINSFDLLEYSNTSSVKVSSPKIYEINNCPR